MKVTKVTPKTFTPIMILIDTYEELELLIEGLGMLEKGETYPITDTLLIDLKAEL